MTCSPSWLYLPPWHPACCAYSRLHLCLLLECQLQEAGTLTRPQQSPDPHTRASSQGPAGAQDSAETRLSLLSPSLDPIPLHQDGRHGRMEAFVTLGCWVPMVHPPAKNDWVTISLEAKVSDIFSETRSTFISKGSGSPTPPIQGKGAGCLCTQVSGLGPGLDVATFLLPKLFAQRLFAIRFPFLLFAQELWVLTNVPPPPGILSPLCLWLSGCR